MKVLHIGHRGAKGYAAENTLASIKKAIELSADGIEIDVFKCKSGELILTHDKKLDKILGQPLNVEYLSYTELSKLLINDKYPIPSLNDVLNVIKPPLFVNIELKGSNTAEATAILIRKYIQNKSWHIQHFLVSSFNWHELELFRSLDNEIPVGVLVDKYIGLDNAIDFGKKINAQAINPHYKLLDKYSIEKIKNNEFKTYTWTVNEEEDIKLMKKLKVHGIISDYPDRI